MTIEQMVEELRVLSDSRRHFTKSSRTRRGVGDFADIHRKQVDDLQRQVPTGLVAWDTERRKYGVYPR